MFGCVFYRQFKYKIVTHARVFSLKPKFDVTENQGLFLANSFHFFDKLFGYENMCSWTKIKDYKIQLPTKSGEIDFEFMDKFIAELEAKRLAELEAYLTTTGLKDYTLTNEEKKVLEDFESKKFEWKKFRIGELFEKVKTKKLPFKADELTKEPTEKYMLPCLTSSFKNQGLNYFAPKNDATILKNVISIPSNSDVYRAYFQSQEFTVLSDAYAISWIYNEKISPNQYLFAVPCINKVTDLPTYSYKNKLGGWNIVKNKHIKLPVKNNQPNYEVMEILISAIQKLVIKDVVLYADRKIGATKNVVLGE